MNKLKKHRIVANDELVAKLDKKIRKIKMLKKIGCVCVVCVLVGSTGCSVNPDIVANEAGFRSIERLVSNAISNAKKRDGQLLSGAEITEMETTRERERTKRERSVNQASVKIGNPSLLQKIKNNLNGMMSATKKSLATTYEQAMGSE